VREYRMIYAFSPAESSAAVPAVVRRASSPARAEGEPPSGQPARCWRYLFSTP